VKSPFLIRDGVLGASLAHPGPKRQNLAFLFSLENHCAYWLLDHTAPSVNTISQREPV